MKKAGKKLICKRCGNTEKFFKVLHFSESESVECNSNGQETEDRPEVYAHGTDWEFEYYGCSECDFTVSEEEIDL